MQINVELSGTDAIIIKGNDYDQTITLPGGGSIKTTDGLVEDMVAPTMGSSFTVRIWEGSLDYDSENNFIGFDKANNNTIYFLDGIANLTLPSGVSQPTPILDVAWITNEPGP